MKRTQIRLAFIAMTLIGVANGTELPIEYKGVRIGAPVSDFRKALPGLKCSPRECELQSSKERWGPIDPLKSLNLAVVDGRGVALYLVFNEHQFSALIDTLTAKYGPADEKTCGPVVIKVETLESCTYSWLHLANNGYLEVRQYSAEPETSVAVMASTLVSVKQPKDQHNAEAGHLANQRYPRRRVPD